MNDKDKHCHYSGLPSPNAYAKDDVNTNDDSKDWYLMFTVFAIGFITLLLLISIMI